MRGRIGRWAARAARIAGLVCLAALPAASVGADLGYEPDVKHLALIIANEDYDLDGTIRAGLNDDPKLGWLRDLNTPCKDAALFKAHLIAAKWKNSEIIDGGCNVNTADMRALITQFRSRLVNMNNTVAVFYYNGHGAQFSDDETSHSYLFGVGAHVDLDKAAQSLSSSPYNTSFVADQAVDLSELTSTLGWQTSNAVLVIIDACRENPLYGKLKTIPKAPKIASPSAAKDKLVGIVVSYATEAGAFADDGESGRSNSFFTTAVAELLSPRRNLDSLLNAVRDKVWEVVKKASPDVDAIQEPGFIGRFVGDWCVWACAPNQNVNPVAVASPPPPTPFAALATPPTGGWTTRTDFALQPAMLTLTSAPATTRRTAPGGEVPLALFDIQQARSDLAGVFSDLGTRFDVFWCDGGTGSADRQRQASDIAAGLAAEAWKHIDAKKGAERIASVRLRSLSQSANTSFDLRFIDDVVVFDNNSGAKAWSAVAAKLSATPLTATPQEGAPSDYIVIAICRAPSTAKTSLVYVQVPKLDLRLPGAALLGHLKSLVPALKAPTTRLEAGIEVRDDGPSRNELRFYFPEDRDNVFKAANALEKLIGIPVTIQYMPRLAPRAKAGQMELWLGRSAPPLPAAFLQVQPLN